MEDTSIIDRSFDVDDSGAGKGYIAGAKNVTGQSADLGPGDSEVLTSRDLRDLAAGDDTDSRWHAPPAD